MEFLLQLLRNVTIFISWDICQIQKKKNTTLNHSSISKITTEKLVTSHNLYNAIF